MGRDKASLPFRGETLLERVVRRIRPVVDDVVVVARKGQALPPLPADVRIVRDDVEDMGPLGGLAPGLRASRADAVFACACDAPFVGGAAVAHVFGRLGGADVAIVEEAGRPCPLFAVYRPSVAARIERLIAERRLRPVYLLDEAPSVRVDAEDLRAFDPDLRSLVNCNTAEAYDAALAATGPSVRVEFFDVARIRAGAAFVDVEGRTLGEALADAASRCPGIVPEIVADPAVGALSPHFRASLGGRLFVDAPSTPLAEGDSVLLINAQAGG
jgi:molybdopterin-guanine dinucleotide biosynthesis protein A